MIWLRSGKRFKSSSVNDEGRAEFPGLAKDGTSAYYAMTILPAGGGDDRLESDTVTLPRLVKVTIDRNDAAIPWEAIIPLGRT